MPSLPLGSIYRFPFSKLYRSEPYKNPRFSL